MYFVSIYGGWLHCDADLLATCIICFFLLFCSFVGLCSFFFFFKQKTAYEMRISDWSSDVCSSDLRAVKVPGLANIWVPPIRNRIDMLATGIKSPIGVK